MCCSVLVFTLCALLCLSLLMYRRSYCGGELVRPLNVFESPSIMVIVLTCFYLAECAVSCSVFVVIIDIAILKHFVRFEVHCVDASLSCGLVYSLIWIGMTIASSWKGTYLLTLYQCIRLHACFWVIESLSALTQHLLCVLPSGWQCGNQEKSCLYPRVFMDWIYPSFQPPELRSHRVWKGSSPW